MTVPDEEPAAGPEVADEPPSAGTTDEPVTESPEEEKLVEDDLRADLFSGVLLGELPEPVAAAPTDPLNPNDWAERQAVFRRAWEAGDWPADPIPVTLWCRAAADGPPPADPAHERRRGLLASLSGVYRRRANPLAYLAPGPGGSPAAVALSFAVDDRHELVEASEPLECALLGDPSPSGTLVVLLPDGTALWPVYNPTRVHR